MLAAMPAFVDHYAVLGVSPSATTAEIRRAYRSLVAREHADRHGSDPLAVERTRSLNLARDVLVDPPRRARFERERRALLNVPRDPLFDTVARTFGQAPPPPPPSPGTPPIEPAPAWLRGVAVGLVAAVTALGVGIGIGAAIHDAARGRRRPEPE
jgi:curved DNA-binding protein CbpA